MQAWWPQNPLQLFKPGYKDRFTYNTQMFAFFIAVLGAVGIALTAIQIGFAISAYYFSADVTISQQTLEVLVAINASLAELTLIIDQLNLTHS
jgi:hypothetical protein